MAAGSRTGSEPGSLAGGRTFHCDECRFAITLLPQDDVPECPHCGSTSFSPASMFSEEDTSGMVGASPEVAPAWFARVRSAVAGQGPHLAWEDDEEVHVVPVAEGFTRVGRSMMADIHLAGPTVSRRHALVHREGDCVTVIDDHSLNGVFVDGEAVDWRQLEDGNELELGGFHLHFISA